MRHTKARRQCRAFAFLLQKAYTKQKDCGTSVNGILYIGQGSTFSFTLRQAVADTAAIGAFDPLAATAEGAERKRSRTPFVAPEARILVVDDTPMNL